MPSYDDDGIGRVEVRRLGVSRARRTKSSTWRRSWQRLGCAKCSGLRAVQVIGPIPASACPDQGKTNHRFFFGDRGASIDLSIAELES